jgi:hypothetical protein
MTSSIGSGGHSKRARTEMDPDRDRAIERLAVVAPHGAGITQLMGDECGACAGGVDTPIRGFASPVVLTGYQGCHEHDGGTILDESWGSRAPTQEGPPLVFPTGVLSVCMRS